MAKCVIKREGEPHLMLSSISLNRHDTCVEYDVSWTTSGRMALLFEEGEADVTIQFIVDVLDFELGGELYFEEIEEEPE